MIRIAIVDDEELEREQIATYLKEYSNKAHLDLTFDLYEDGKMLLMSLDEYDLVFLDIELKNENGVDLAKKIREKNEYISICFITNLTNYALAGYEVNATNYLIKPINYFILEKEMNKIIKRLSFNSEFLTIKIDGGMLHLPIREITYVETEDRHLRIHTLKQSYPCSLSMKALCEMLSENVFFRTHNVYLVNLYHVEAVIDTYALVHGEQVLVSRHRKKELIDALTNFRGMMV